MPLQSKKTIKVTDIPQGITAAQYQKYANDLRSSAAAVKKHFWSSPSQSLPNAPPDDGGDSTRQSTEQLQPLSGVEQSVGQSFATLHGNLQGTISFASEKLKEKALSSHKKSKSKIRMDDDFGFLTVLHDSGEAAEFDICAVHGLSGNAMDTWTAENNMMWLRDILPLSDGFAKSRIMVFGFDSDLTANKSVMDVEDWAETLLTHVSNARTSEQERKRPILFVCHSLGGLVGRKAMIRLEKLETEGLKLEKCCLLFLATPHDGSGEADWSDFLVALAGTVAGVRMTTVNALKSSNPMSSRDKESFLCLKPCPLFKCLSEGERMNVCGTYRYVVTTASATLDPSHRAQNVMSTSHSSICKFDSNSAGPYIQVRIEMKKLLDAVKGRDVFTALESRLV